MPAATQAAVCQPKGGTADPWAVATNAMEQIRRGGPDQLRVLVARAMGALGLPELAGLWADTVPATPELTPLVAQIREALPPLTRAERAPEERIDTARTNLGIRPGLSQRLGSHFEDWAARQRRTRWFVARDANCVGLDPTRRVDDPRALVRWGDEVARVAGRIFPSNRIDPSGPPAPIVLDGLRSAASLTDLVGRFPRLENRAWAALSVVEPDADALFDVLSERDLRPILGEERLGLFVGPDAKDRLLAAWRERGADWNSLSYVADRLAGPDRAFQARLAELSAVRATEYRGLLARNNAAYCGRDGTWWQRRYDAALAGRAEALRVMVLTTRYSTYIQHASRDLCDAFESGGVRCRLVIEPDDTSRTDGLRIARAVADFEPDLFLVINYTRGQFADSVPRQMPHCCWVQDAMPHLFTRATGADVDELSIVVGNVFKEFVTKHRYPERRCLTFDVPASASKFRADPRPECRTDVLIATNHGEAPDAMAERLDHECVESGGPPGLIPEAYRRINAGIVERRHGHLIHWLHDALAPLFDRSGIDPTGENAATIIRDAALPLSNRILRHRIVEWAWELAEERGWRLTIAGRGWENHPRFSRFAVGETPHGPALRDLYNDSLVTLHASSAWIFHQRIHESLLAGSFPLQFYKPDDLAYFFRPARVRSSTDIEPTCSRVDDRRLHFHAIDHPIAALGLVAAQRFAPGTFPDLHPERNQDAERAAESGLIPWRDGLDEPVCRLAELTKPADQMRFVSAVSEGFFRTRDELAGLIERCRSEPAWRLSRIEFARSVVERCYTMEGAATGIVRFMRDRLGEPAASSRSLREIPTDA